MKETTLLALFILAVALFIASYFYPKLTQVMKSNADRIRVTQSLRA